MRHPDCIIQRVHSMTKEAFDGVIAALEANKNCSWECAISIVREHAKAWENQPSYIVGWNDALKELEKAVETVIKRMSSRL